MVFQIFRCPETGYFLESWKVGAALLVNMQRSIGAVRGFAKAAKAANNKPPIKIFGIPGRYAEATYVAASKVSAPLWRLICDLVWTWVRLLALHTLLGPQEHPFLDLRWIDGI